MEKASIAKTLQTIKINSPSIYNDLKAKFLYHTNKIEGSTFTLPEIETLISENIVSGVHPFDDVIETKNSLELFDYIIENYQEELTAFKIREYHQILKKNTKDAFIGQAGSFKKFPNMLSGRPELKLAEPHEVYEKIIILLKEKPSTLEEIAKFHATFEKIHPFLDGNGRIGRFILLKQCLQNNMDLIYINSKNVMEYKEALFLLQMKKQAIPLIKIFQESQELFKKEFSIFESIRKNYSIEINNFTCKKSDNKGLKR